MTKQTEGHVYDPEIKGVGPDHPVDTANPEAGRPLAPESVTDAKPRRDRSRPARQSGTRRSSAPSNSRSGAAGSAETPTAPRGTTGNDPDHDGV